MWVMPGQGVTRPMCGLRHANGRRWIFISGCGGCLGWVARPVSEGLLGRRSIAASPSASTWRLCPTQHPDRFRAVGPSEAQSQNRWGGGGGSRKSPWITQGLMPHPLELEGCRMPKKIDPELKARAVMLVTEHQQDYWSMSAAARALGKQVGLVSNVRRWVESYLQIAPLPSRPASPAYDPPVVGQVLTSRRHPPQATCRWRNIYLRELLRLLPQGSACEPSLLAKQTRRRHMAAPVIEALPEDYCGDTLVARCAIQCPRHASHDRTRPIVRTPTNPLGTHLPRGSHHPPGARTTPDAR